MPIPLLLRTLARVNKCGFKHIFSLLQWLFFVCETSCSISFWQLSSSLQALRSVCHHAPGHQSPSSTAFLSPPNVSISSCSNVAPSFQAGDIPGFVYFKVRTGCPVLLPVTWESISLASITRFYSSSWTMDSSVTTNRVPI